MTAMFEPSFNSIDVGPAMVPWTQGKVLHWYQGSFNLGRFRGDQPKCCVVPMDFFPLPPIGNEKAVMSVFAEDTLMIHARSPNKDAAAEFIDWMVSPDAMTKKLEIDKPYPVQYLGRPFAPDAKWSSGWPKSWRDSGSFTFMHVDHATPPAISDKFLDGVQGVLSWRDDAGGSHAAYRRRSRKGARQNLSSSQRSALSPGLAWAPVSTCRLVVFRPRKPGRPFSYMHRGVTILSKGINDGPLQRS